MKKFLIGYILSVFILAGCSYSVHTNAFPHLKNIQVEVFKNHSMEYGLEEEMNTSLTNQFNSDGRLAIVTENPDALLEGEIRDYSDKIYSFDETGAEEYQVKIMFKISFTDLVRNEEIWSNENLILSEKYSAINELIEAKTEEEAREKIMENLFETILKNTLEEW